MPDKSDDLTHFTIIYSNGAMLTAGACCLAHLMEVFEKASADDQRFAPAYLISKAGVTTEGAIAIGDIIAIVTVPPAKDEFVPGIDDGGTVNYGGTA